MNRCFCTSVRLNTTIHVKMKGKKAFMENMFVNLVSNPNGSGNYTGIVGGAMIRQTTDADRRLFGMTDNSVKDAINKFFGRRPDDVFYNDPVPWGNLYQQYGWPPVTLTLRPVSAVFTGTDVVNSALATHEVTNNTNKVVQADVSFTTQKDNTEETNWSQTTTLTVTQSISFSIKFFGSDTSISFAQDWQKGGSHSQTISVGSSVSIFVELDPGETVVVTNWGDIGSANVKVTYIASLSGLVFANYGNTYQGHHFWGLDVNSVLNAMGVSNSITVVQNMKLHSYLYTKTSIGYPSKANAREQTVYTNRSLVFPADPTEQLPQGVKGFVSIPDIAVGSGDVPTMSEIFEDEPLKKGTAGHDAQNRRNKDDDEDELFKKGTAGQDAQSRRNKDDDEDELFKKGTAGQDAQGRRNKGADEDEARAKGTAGQDAQGRRNKSADSVEGEAL